MKKRQYKWEQRTYEVPATASQVLQLQKQMAEQDEIKDSLILLKMSYNPSKGKVSITDKVKVEFTETQSPQLPKESQRK